ncbi:hypothetical protein EKO27_g10526 [Xylaria grammica]|uniref:Uncharacterized protein n=1 Tax=Xylaria grammica TaxID=363999 RepID=A0A439CQX8_9PEZI|nr:hypothetical protein EKO27_g10526 [Xylaria grammica]
MHFQMWYPAWDLKTRMESNCSAELHDYMNESLSWCAERNYQCIAGVAVDCLLTALPETWKADMGAASVLLGLLPTTLSIVGSGPFETGLLAQTRPFLALMLAFGSPVMYPIRIFDYPNLADMFRPKKGAISLPQLSRRAGAAMVILQYLIAFLAVGNPIWVSIELGTRTVVSFKP